VFDHVTVRVADLGAARRFYGLAMSTLGFEGPATDGHFFEWWDFSVSEAREDRPLTRNLHVAFIASSRDAVDEWWRVMTEAGYPDDGAPGPRPQYSADYYGAFVRDPDGNSVEAVHYRDSVGENHIDHLWIRVADIQASRRFWETVAPLVAVRVEPSSIGADLFHVENDERSFALVDGEPLTRNVHIAFPVPENAAVDEFHRALVAAGYRDNGGPGERRYHPGYYGAFVLDPDGNNIEAVCHNR
jgi:catechol 2,3-dioxygenase-like lactoylglutathione lyase family enzyme